MRCAQDQDQDVANVAEVPAMQIYDHPEQNQEEEIPIKGETKVEPVPQTVPEPKPQEAPPAPKPEPTKPKPEPTKPEKVQVEFGFNDSTGSKKTFLFSEKPLGIDFDMQMPIKIKAFKPDSHAQKCGVQVGMILATVDGRNIEKLTYDDAFAQIAESVNKIAAKQT